MRIKNFYVRLLLVSLLFYCCTVERNIENEILSPNGSFKVIEQSVSGDATTKMLSKVFLVHKNFKLKHNTTPILITTNGNILNISWINNNNILINVKSEALILFQVVRDYEFTIYVESQEKLIE